MNTVASTMNTRQQHFLAWLPIAAGLGALFVPVFIDLLRGPWKTDEQAHGPIVFAIACWLLYRKWPEMWQSTQQYRNSVLSWPVFIAGLLFYTVGRSQDLQAVQLTSLILLLSGVLLVMRGRGSVKAQWFALMFMFFMIPLPGPIVDTLTMPMKMGVSYVTEHILYAAGYPIARNGVILQIGQYKLLVADACAGLHTLFTLEALGLLYLNVIRHESFVRNITLAVLIVPISFSANVIRVIVLTLITYHLGDEAGQGFLHGFAGMVLFLSALLLIMAVDSVLRLISEKIRPQHSRCEVQR